MDPKYKVVSLFFSLDSSPSPYHITSDIEQCFHTQDCVLSIKAFCRNLFLCTLLGEEVVKRAKSTDKIRIDKQHITYKIVDPEVTVIKIELPVWQMRQEDFQRILRPYANILLSDLDDNSPNPTYYAIVDLKRDLPSVIKSRFGNLEVQVIES